jgi:hypothetical protein
MPSAFKPLVPSTPAPGLTGRVAAAGEAAGKFAPLTQSPSTAKAPAPGGIVKAAAAPVPAALRTVVDAPESAPPCTATPAVTNVIKQGDRITHIEVRCGCGEVITIECGY